MKITLKWDSQSGDGKRAFVVAEENDGWKDLRIEVDTDDCDGEHAKAAMQEVIDRCNAANSPPTDTEMLDWMASHGAYVSHSRDGECCNVWFRYDPNDDGGDSVPVEGYPQKCYDTPREAIAAAMRFKR